MWQSNTRNLSLGHLGSPAPIARTAIVETGQATEAETATVTEGTGAETDLAIAVVIDTGIVMAIDTRARTEAMAAK